MTPPLKVGLIGLDTSHAPAFTKIFNDPSYEHHLPGFKVVAAFPGASPDFELSYNRVEGFTKTLNEEYGVAILESPEAVAEQVDVVFITAVDGRAHRAFFEKVASYGKPTFIDKPMTTSLKDAQAIVQLAQANNIALMSCSSLRYSDRLTEALAANDEPVLGVDAFGPMNLQAELPGLYWYGCHTAELILRAMGPGCVEVKATTTEHHDLITGRWADGRIASFRGLRESHSRFGLTLHRKSGPQFVDASAFTTPWYASMLREIMPALTAGQWPVPAENLLGVIAFMEAANTSRETGEPVAVAQGATV